MKLKFNEDLSEQEIYATGPELAETMGQDRDENGNRIYEYPHTKEQFVAKINNPVLMSDDHKFYNITDYTARQTVQLLLRKPMVIVEYDGLKMEFEHGKYPGVRSPNIDTLFSCNVLKDLDFTGIKSVMEAGSGPGFAAKYIGMKAPNIEEIVMNDINPNAEKYFNDTNTDTRAKFVLGDAKKYLEGKDFDLIFCNPPYAPRKEAIEDNPYEGLELVIYLIKNFKKNLIINISNLSEDAINPIFDSCGAKVELLAEKEVPLKVGNILNNKERLDYLVNEKGLRDEYHDGHKYRQTIRIFKLSR